MVNSTQQGLLKRLELVCKNKWREEIGDAFTQTDPAEIVPKLLENGIPCEDLATCIGTTIGQRVYQAANDEDALAKGNGWLLTNKAIYLANPFDCKLQLQLSRGKHRILIREWGVIASKEVSGVTEVESDIDVKKFEQHAHAEIARIMNKALEYKSSDIHLLPVKKKVEVRLRVDGEVITVANMPNDDDYRMIANVLLDMSGNNGGEYLRPATGKFRWKLNGNDQTIDVRLEMAPAKTDSSIVPKFTLRLIGQDTALVSLNNLGIPDTQTNPQLTLIKKISGMANGIVLVTGPTGSGKTTTLMALVRYIKMMFPGKMICTLEDPVENEIDGVMQVEINEKADLNFESGLRSFMRHDPDVILVGEIRDIQTLQNAIQASLTGHLVFSTLHTNSAVESISRLINLGADATLLGDSLRAVTAQRMLRKVCQYCSHEVEYGELCEMRSQRILQLVPSELDQLKYRSAGQRYSKIKSFPDPSDKIRIAGDGCTKCHNQGYSGRHLVSELMVIDHKMKGMISESASTETIQRYLSDPSVNFPNMWAHAGLLIKQGVTTLKEAETRLNPQQEFGNTFSYDREQNFY